MRLNDAQSPVVTLQIREIGVDFKVSVTVSAADTLAPIAGANVKLDTVNKVTDAEGYVEHRADPGQHELLISAIHYLTYQEELVVIADIDLDRTLTPGEPPTPGCWIATAAYGSPLAPELEYFRAYRDNVLLKTPIGRFLVHAYYRTSPPFAAIIRKSETLKRICRSVLNQILEQIR